MNSNLRFYIAFQLVGHIAKAMGYHFSPERVARIADMSLRCGNNGYATLLSTAVAFEWDLLLYGDPLKGQTIIIGVDKCQEANETKR